MHTPPLEEQLLWERRARELLQWGAMQASRAEAPEQVLAALLAAVCHATQWPFGHVYHVGPDDLLVSRDVWHITEPERFARYRAVTAVTTFARGVGLPGRVLADGKAHWITDIELDDNFPRRTLAKDIGVHAAFAFPIFSDGRVVEVLEFASPHAIAPDLPLLEVMMVLGAGVGWLLERTHAEATIREGEQRLRSITETANDAIVSADASGHIVTWNGAATKMFGYTDQEMAGESLARIVPDRFREQHARGMARVSSGGPHHVIGRTVELAALHRDGHEVQVELSLATWSAGGERFFTGILRDISERKRIALALEQTAQRLAQSERKAVRASAAKSLFLANMSHELRTPLNAILGFVQLLARDPSLTHDQRDGLAVILRSGEHLLGLVNDVLSIAKIEAGEVSLSASTFDPWRMLGALRELFAVRAHAKGLSLEFVVDPALPEYVLADDGKLRQVLINLLGNAIKFTTTGGIILRVGYHDGVARFEVEDSGPGLSPDDQASLFQAFVQTSGGARTGEGTGLGLAISRDFARLMGGDIVVESVLGRGSRFIANVPLPVSSRDSSPAPRRVVGLAPGQPTRKVLVVDNSDDNRVLLSRLMRAFGFVVEEARDGAEAVRQWQSFRPDFVWMDMRMPVMDGYEATRQIRALERESGAARTAIVAITASVFEHDRPAILEAGCDQVVSKPFRDDVLFGVMGDLLSLELAYASTADDAVSDDGPLMATRLAGLPEATRAALHQALMAGDDLEAKTICEQVAADDAQLGRALGALVGEFQFDRVLDLLERATPS